MRQRASVREIDFQISPMAYLETACLCRSVTNRHYRRRKIAFANFSSRLFAINRSGMEITMDRQDRELVRLINSAKKGNKDSFERLCELIYHEVYNLVAFIYTSKETRTKLTKHVLVRIYKNLDDFDISEMDVHLWLARFTTLEVYRICVKQNGELFGTEMKTAEYRCETVEDDVELVRCAAEYNEAFLDREKLEEILIDFKDMTKGQKILYQMFCYESYTLDELEDLLEVDSTFLGTQLMAVRTKLGLSDISLTGAGGQDVLAADEPVQYEKVNDDAGETDYEPSGREKLKNARAAAVKNDDSDKVKSPILGFIPDKVLVGIITVVTGLIVILSVVLVISIGNNKKEEAKGVVNQSRATAAAGVNQTTQEQNDGTQEQTASDESTEDTEGQQEQQNTDGNDNAQEGDGNTGDNGNGAEGGEGGNTEDEGNTGEGGNTGDEGNNGNDGNTGDEGGSTGDEGNTGDEGGSTGDEGNTGDEGGSTGDEGNTGDEGGSTGDEDNTGDEGGSTGDEGNTGDEENTGNEEDTGAEESSEGEDENSEDGGDQPQA